jgi:transposase
LPEDLLTAATSTPIATLTAEGGTKIEQAARRAVRWFEDSQLETDPLKEVLAELSCCDLVPAIWLPDPWVRGERERARWRLHLVRHRTALKNRIHQTLVAFGVPCPVSGLFGVKGRELLERLALPDPWAQTVNASLALIDDLAAQITECERQLRVLGAEHEYVPLLMSAPGIAWVLGYTIAAEIGDVHRFASPGKLCGYTGLCPRVYQSGERDHRGSLAKNGPKYLRWALIEAATHAARHPVYRERYQRTAKRLGRQRGKDRAGRDRPQARRGDLAHAHPRATLRSGRRHVASGRMTPPA